MVTRREYPVRFSPRGVADAWDSTDTFAGACRELQNLIFDQSNPEIVVARPGVGSPMTKFQPFTNPTGVTVQVAIGNMIYGMVSTGRNPGYDEPFAFNTKTQSFTTISGVTSGNVPATQSITGDWITLTMATIGIKIIITHPGFSGTGNNFFGVLDISNPASPAWTCGNTGITGLNTGTNVLPSVPNAVANFNNRAYFACKNLAYYSDPLIPGQMTNAGQALTVGDTTPIIAFAGLPVQTATAGVVGALMIFKGFQIWQVTGDAAITGSLSQNYISLNVGCISPNTIVQTPVGMIFAAIDGPYYVSPIGQVLPLTKDATKLVQDIQQPYQNIVNPTRASASYTGSIYRICMDTVINGSYQTVDFWFDVTIRRWSGPHTFNYDTISEVGNFFVLSSRNYGAQLFASQYIPALSSVYNDNGVALSIQMTTAQLPKTQNINMKQVIESTIELANQGPSLTYTIIAQDEDFNTLGTTNISLFQTLPTWGSGYIWGGGALWSSSNNAPLTYSIPWQAPLVFKKISFTITAQSSYSLGIGTAFCKYQDLGFTNVFNQSTLIAPTVWDGDFNWDDGAHFWQ